ncbi:hypothetical protein HKX48_005389 [Thoreauomyces humboldtii]|nr:hypothetical protein HKX48_005389 [Thoreauomyces humboldtii]
MSQALDHQTQPLRKRDRARKLVSQALGPIAAHAKELSRHSSNAYSSSSEEEEQEEVGASVDGGASKPTSSLSPFVGTGRRLRHNRTPSIDAISVSSNESSAAAAAEEFGGGVRSAIRRKLSMTRPRGVSNPTIPSASTTSLSLPRTAPRVASESSVSSKDVLDEIAHLVDFSEKTNRDVHRIFPEIEESESMVDSYSCAVQKDLILNQGRLYLTTAHVCFNANIFGFQTNIVIPVLDIASVEKTTFLKIPNAVQITMQDGKVYLFTSFVHRESAYLKLSHLLHTLKKAEDSHPAETTDEEVGQPIPSPPSIVADGGRDSADYADRPKDLTFVIIVVAVVCWSLATVMGCGALMWRVKSVVQDIEGLVIGFGKLPITV